MTAIILFLALLFAGTANAGPICDRLERSTRALLETGKEAFVQYNLLKLRALDPGVPAYLKQEHIKTARAYQQRMTASQVQRLAILDRIEALDCQGDSGLFVVIPVHD